jgi:N-acetylglutamate synthase-like GNAT family acetyltransferase
MEPEILYLADNPLCNDQCAEWAFDAWGKYNQENDLAKRAESFKKHQNKDALPLTLLAKVDGKFVGMASLREADGVHEELKPWLGSLYIDRAYRSKNIGERLIDATKKKAREMGYKELFLLTFEETLPDWYQTLGWTEVMRDTFKGNPIIIMKTPL